ncbi:MAG: 3'(2'),5'-bisphosphate nucleotidase CysQ, partial [Proteobacteria bacterium]|nr:3'(2'),5'-bisphosphate nucleotidase CysQ [Pseudomonadota bacterium]
NIALIEKMEPVLGVIFAPALDRMFHGFKGGGSVEKSPGREGPIQVRQLPDSGSRAVASRSHRNEETNRWLEAHQIRETVSIGSSLKFCLVACGEADVYPRFGPTMEWDTAAGDAILRAAGGLTANPDGSVFRYGKAGYRNSSFIAYGQPDRWEPKASV